MPTTNNILSDSPTDVPTEDIEQMNDTMTHLTPRARQDVGEEETSALTATTDQAERMRWHYRLGHLSFKKLIELAVLGSIPK